MIGTVVNRMVPEGDLPSPLNYTCFDNLTANQQRVIVASSVTFLMGIFQVNLSHFLIFCDVFVFFRPNFLSFLFLIFLFYAARHGSSTSGIHRCIPVRHFGVRLHHSSCHPDPGFPAQVCVGTGGARHQWCIFYYICESRNSASTTSCWTERAVTAGI